jgi:CBS-domain-containing membrane protein
VLVHEVMSTPVVSVAPETTIRDAVRLLAEHGITAVPVIDDQGELLGVLSEADVLLEAFLPDQRAHDLPVQITSGPPRVTVSEVMNRHVLTVPAGADLAEAADLMVSTTVKSLPVVAGDQVVGMVSRRDLVAVLARRDSTIEAAVDDLIHASGYDWTAEVNDGVVTVEGPERAEDVAIAKVLVGTVPGIVGVYFPAQHGGPG